MTFSGAVTKYPNKSNFRKKQCLLLHSVIGGGHGDTSGKVWPLELETSGHIVSASQEAEVEADDAQTTLFLVRTGSFLVHTGS